MEASTTWFYQLIKLQTFGAAQQMHRPGISPRMPHQEIPQNLSRFLPEAAASSVYFWPSMNSLTSLMMMSTFSGSCTVSITPWMTVIWSASCRQTRNTSAGQPIHICDDLL